MFILISLVKHFAQIRAILEVKFGYISKCFLPKVLNLNVIPQISKIRGSLNIEEVKKLWKYGRCCVG